MPPCRHEAEVLASYMTLIGGKVLTPGQRPNAKDNIIKETTVKCPRSTSFKDECIVFSGPRSFSSSSTLHGTIWYTSRATLTGLKIPLRNRCMLRPHFRTPRLEESDRNSVPALLKDLESRRIVAWPSAVYSQVEPLNATLRSDLMVQTPIEMAGPGPSGSETYRRIAY